MARFLIFDTQAVNNNVNDYGEYSAKASLWNTAGYGPHGENRAPLTYWLDASPYVDPLTVPAAAGSNRSYSYPVRLFGGAKPVDKIVYEFYLTGAAQNINVCWYQEFYYEYANPYMPRVTHMPPLPSASPWVREQVEVVDNSGLITHVNAVRQVTMNSQINNTGDLAIAVGRHHDARVFPMVVSGLWTRLRVFTTTAIAALMPGGDTVLYAADCVSNPAPWRLRVYANVGGHEQVAAMDACTKQDLLWFDCPVAGPAVWDPAAAAAGAPSYSYSGSWPT